MTTFITIIFGLLIAGIATALVQCLTKKVTIAHWVINLVLGALGATAAYQLLPGAYGPVIAGFTIVPMAIGALVLAGIGSWTMNKILKNQRKKAHL